VRLKFDSEENEKRFGRKKEEQKATPKRGDYDFNH
jgi:hypothetical protein